jgi:hypothetical protein
MPYPAVCSDGFFGMEDKERKAGHVLIQNTEDRIQNSDNKNSGLMAENRRQKIKI